MKTIKTLTQLAKENNITNSYSSYNNIIREYDEILESLDTIDKSIIVKDVYTIPVYEINKNYAVDLDSLEDIVNYKNTTLKEAIKDIKNSNEIDDDIKMYCVLPEDINYDMTLESFIKLNNTLLESDIYPLSTREFNDYDFISEGTKLDQMKENQIRKLLKNYEKTLASIKNKKEQFENLSEKEQKKYCLNKSIKNIITGILISMPTAMIGGVVYSTIITMKGDNTILGPENYKMQLNNFIRAYSIDIKAMKKRLKELEKKNNER